MSWQLGTLLVLGLVLVGGLAWFERSRPSPRLLAAVAALAALAVAGRVALAPVPNVVVTTDVVLLAGYTLGAPSGFGVGALAALISNFWLGQGPWTPWQMAGWGIVGIGGAALAMLTARRLGRWGLAAAAAVAGLLYGALLDLSTMVSFGGEQSLDRYLALSARAIPFNVAHAAGNAAIMLLVGPALVRMLTRYRERSEVVWEDMRPDPGGTAVAGSGAAATVLALLAAAALLAGGLTGSARAVAAEATASAAGSSAAVGWLARSQNSDGGWGTAPGASSNPGMTGWAALGLAAGGRNPADVSSSGRSGIDYLRRQAGAVTSTGDLERTILVLRAAGLSARNFGGRDLAAELRSRQSGNGSYEGQVNLTAFAIMARIAAGERPSALKGAAGWLRDAQNGDGGWASVASGESEPDSTGAALQALALAAPSSGAIGKGAAWLAQAQKPDGGWSLVRSQPSNSQSTAWAVQGLIAAGRSPGSVRNNGNGGLDYLAARRRSDGHYSYSRGSDQTPVWVTAQALAAVNGKTYPLAPVPRRRSTGSSGGGNDSRPAPGGGSGGAPRSAAPDSEARKASRKRGDGKPKADRARSRRERTAVPGAGTLLPAASGPALAPSPDGTALPATPVMLGGLGGLALALAGGWLLYRRRLP